MKVKQGSSMTKILVTILLISTFNTYGSKDNSAQKLSCKLSEKTFKTQLDNVLKRPKATAELLWDSILKKPLAKSRAKDLAENYRYYQDRLYRKMGRRARKHFKNNSEKNLYNASEDKKMDRLLKKVQETQESYNSYILKNLRTRFAQNVSVKDKNGDYFNFGHNQDSWVEFKSDLFTKDLDLSHNHDLDIDFFDRKDINGGLYNIRTSVSHPGLIEIGKKSGDESAALSDLVSGTLNDGTYYELKATYKFSFGKSKPEVEFFVNQYPSMESEGDPIKTLRFDEKGLTQFVSQNNCQNGLAINKIPSIVDDTIRENTKESDSEKTESKKETDVIKN